MFKALGIRGNGRSASRRMMPRILESLEDRRMMAVTRYVDDDYLTPNGVTTFSTIASAVAGSVAGDTIKVKPGTYEENVVVDKKLTILGASAWLPKAENPTFASIVDPVDNLTANTPAFGFNLQANDIVIKGFTIAELDGVTDPDGSVGINTSNQFSGYKILDNVIENHVFGIYLNTATTAGVKLTDVSGNTIRNNNVTGAANGNGIYSDQGARNVRITCNTFTGQQNYDVLFANTLDLNLLPTFLITRIDVSSNTLKNSGGIQFNTVTNGKIEWNYIQNSALNGILLDGGNSLVSVRYNTLKDPGAVQGYNGIIVADSNGFGPNHDNTIQSNTIVNAGLSGIIIRDSDHNVVKWNFVTGSKGFDVTDLEWGNGISLVNADFNTIDGNVVSRNARNGIFADLDSSGNIFKWNFSTKNAVRKAEILALLQEEPFDYRDNSTGLGTANTANVYQHNSGKTQSRPGLIQHFV